MPLTPKDIRRQLATLQISQEKALELAFLNACDRAAVLSRAVYIPDFDGVFSLHNFPAINVPLSRLIEQLTVKIQTIIVDGITAQWQICNEKNDRFVDDVLYKIFNTKDAEKAKKALSRYYNHNDDALKAFIARKDGDMNLSKRVWNLTSNFKREIETGISVSMKDGRAAADLASDLKQYLKFPDKLFRRVRDHENGELILSSRASLFHPGPGVYRSSYRNAFRLTRTENNIAYHTADYERWMSLDFVVGIHVGLSNNHPVSDICNTLQGDYPKAFKFTGWHPQCRCIATTILKTMEEMRDDTQKIISGAKPALESSNSVLSLPESFRSWYEENAKTISHAKHSPYFLKDNAKLIQTSIRGNKVP